METPTLSHIGSFELAHVKVVVEASLLKKLFMGATFDDLPLIYDQYLVCVAYGAEPMGYHDRGSSLH